MNPQYPNLWKYSLISPPFFLYAHSRNFIIHKYWHTLNTNKNMTFELLKVCRQSKPGLNWFFFNFFISFCLLFFSFHFLHISLFRFVFVYFVLLSLVSFYFVFISLISFRFVSFCWFRFVSFRFRWFRFVSFLFRFALYRCPNLST